MSGQPGGGPGHGQRPGPNGVLNGNMAMPPQPRPDGNLGGNVPGSAPGGSMSQQNLNQIVIEYLSKKGYTRTEAMLRTESAQHDPDGRPIVKKLDEEGGKMYQAAMDQLISWIDGVLEIYKPELRRILWPIFVYSYLDLVGEAYSQGAKEYLINYRTRFEAERKDELTTLAAISLPEHVSTADIAKSYHNHRYRLTISTSGYEQLVIFLERNKDPSGKALLRIVNSFMKIVPIDRASEDRISLANMLSRSKAQEDFPAEDEGIPGHNPGSANLEQVAGASVLTKLKLGPLEMEEELLEDVMAELDVEDAKNPPAEGRSSLRSEFEQMIKKEDADSFPVHGEVPLPPSRMRDVLLEVNKVKENRDRFRIDTRTGGVASGISVCMWTFHNSHDGICCIQISDDNRMIAVGLDQHYIRVWNMDGKPLKSTMDNVQPQASRRLIGHSAPVYALSFSPSIDDPNAKDDDDPMGLHTRPEWLLSCSADKSIRLWHLNTWQCIAVYKGHLGPVWDITWGPFGHYFLTGSHDKTARLWSTEHIACLRMFVGHDSDVDHVCFHPNNLYVFTGSGNHDKTIRMWAITNGFQVRMFTGHTGNITALACSASGKILASADDSGTIILWDLMPGRLLKRMRGHGRGGIWSLAWSVESNVLISGGMDGTVRLWDVDKPSDAPGQGKVVGEGGAGAKMDLGGPSGQGGSSKKKGKETVVSPDQIAAFPTKKSPVYKVKFTRMNLAVAAGAYLP